MLVVSRRKGSRIVAGEVEFCIVKIRGGSVQVGIRAPEGVKVFRGELLDGDGGQAEAEAEAEEMDEGAEPTQLAAGAGGSRS
jgi:carbon storage regulator CsrA